MKQRAVTQRRGSVALVAGTAAGLLALVPATATATPPARGISAATMMPANASTNWHTPGYSWTQTLARPGVSVYSGTLSDRSSHPSWTVTIFAPATNSLTGQATTTELGAADWATQTADRLRAAGYPPRVDALDWPDFSDTPHGVQGYRVRTGDYSSQASAQAAAASLKQSGFNTATVQWTGYDPDHQTDAEQVHVAVIDPANFDGTVRATHGNVIAQRTTTSELSRQAGAVVGVNGGFFVTSSSDGYQGVPSGLAAYDGKLQSMAVGDRTALQLSPSGRPSIRHLDSSVTLLAAGASHDVAGINRYPGVVRDCGRPGLTPTSRPRQDFTCTASDEMVLFTDRLGAALPTGAGSQVTVDRTGRVLSAGPRGGSVPVGGYAVQAIGSAAGWLASHAAAGSRVSVQQALHDGVTGRRVPVGQGIVSAAPMLVHRGQTAIDAATEGVIDPNDRSFNYAWGEIRQPRTMAGIDPLGRLLLVTVDGREPGISEGLSLAEESTLLEGLGATEAMNLDGGGSTAMAVDGALVNHPSDATGERADGDAVVVVPRHSD